MITYSLLALFIIAGYRKWLLLKHAWLLLAVLMAGYFEGIFQLVGILSVIAFGGICYFLSNRQISYLLILPVAILFFHHFVPGINNIKIFDGIKLSSQSAPFTLYLNFDKPWIAIFLVLFGTIPTITQASQLKTLIIQVAKYLTLLVLLMMPLATGFGFTQVDLKFPPQIYLFAFNNLVFTSITEEVLFRGFIINKIANRHIALLVSSLLFGLVHFKGGPIYLLLATMAGLFYGHIYQKTKTIEAPILLHFLFNLIHFIFFSYPSRF